MKHLCAIIIGICFSLSGFAQTVQEEIEMESIGAVADSDAALEEAKEFERLAKKEKAQAQQEVARMKNEIANAKKREKDYQKRIIQAGKNRKISAKEISEAKKKTAIVLAATKKVQQAYEKERLKLEEVNAQRSLALEQKSQAEAKAKKVELEMAKIKGRFKDSQKEKIETEKKLARASANLKMIEKKAQLSFDNTNKEAASVMNSIEDQREDLNKIAKRLDQMEVEVETERSFIEDQRKNSSSTALSKNMRRMPSKVAKVSSYKCNVRNSPSGRGSILGKHNRGRKMRIRQHNDNWFSVIHNGETAYMGASCFKN